MLKSDRICLRTVRRKDLDTLYELMCDVENRGPHYPVNIESETSFQERFSKDGLWSAEYGMMVIADRKSSRIMGTVIHFKPVRYYEAFEIGYIIYDPKDRGKGIACEAVNMFVKYLFSLRHFERIQIQVEPQNLASKKVAKKCGFTYEGTARKAFFSCGQAVDIEIHSLLRGEFEKLNR